MYSRLRTGAFLDSLGVDKQDSCCEYKKSLQRHTFVDFVAKLTILISLRKVENCGLKIAACSSSSNKEAMKIVLQNCQGLSPQKQMHERQIKFTSDHEIKQRKTVPLQKKTASFEYAESACDQRHVCLVSQQQKSTQLLLLCRGSETLSSNFLAGF